MFRDISERLLNRQESNISFHATQTVEPRQPILNVNVKVLCAIYVVAQLVQLLIGFSLVQQIDITTLVTQRCIVTIILTLGYIQFFDQTQYSLDQDLIRIMGAISFCQLLASFLGFFAMQNFPFSEVCGFHQLTAGYILVITHFLIQPGNLIILLISFIQTTSTFLFSGSLMYVLVTLLQPFSLALMAVLKSLMNKQLSQFTLLLYTNLLGLPVYVILNIAVGEVQNVFDGTFFLEIILMCIFQMLAYLAMYEVQMAQTQPIHIWALAGVVTLSSLGVQQMIHGVPLDYGTLAIIFIVFTTIALHK